MGQYVASSKLTGADHSWLEEDSTYIMTVRSSQGMIVSTKATVTSYYLPYDECARLACLNPVDLQVRNEVG